MSEVAGDRPPQAASLPSCQGGLDAVSGGRVYGWAWDPAAPDRRLGIELFCAGAPMGTTVAELPREDLIEFGIGDGAHAFEFALPADHAGATFDEVTAVIAGSSVPLIRFREIDTRTAAPDGLPLMSSLSHRMAVMESMLGQMAQVIRAVNDRCTAAEGAAAAAPLVDQLEKAVHQSAAADERLDRLERDFRTAEATLVRLDALLKRVVGDQAERKSRWWHFFRR